MSAHHKEDDYKKNAIQAARQLMYPNYIIKRIENAKSEAEIERIMNHARRELL